MLRDEIWPILIPADTQQLRRSERFSGDTAEAVALLVVEEERIQQERRSLLNSDDDNQMIWTVGREVPKTQAT